MAHQQAPKQRRKTLTHVAEALTPGGAEAAAPVEVIPSVLQPSSFVADGASASESSNSRSQADAAWWRSEAGRLANELAAARALLASATGDRMLSGGLGSTDLPPGGAVVGSDRKG